MEFQFEPGRVWAEDETGRVTAEVLFPEENGAAVITRTFVDSSLRGRGVANLLLENAVSRIRAEGKKARPVCSYAVKWFEDHPEQGDLL
ncbi:MAG: GNAT family N-acetyltransferase [Candidatus Enterenecus sp.]